VANQRPLPGDYFRGKQELLSQWPVNTTFTGTGTISVRTPAKGLRFVVRAWQLAVVVDTQLAATTGITVLFFDDSTSNPGPGISWFAAKSQMGDGRLASQMQFDGWWSKASDNDLLIGASGTIGAGVIRVSGVVYGAELPL
jgi:hypothetical protein